MFAPRPPGEAYFATITSSWVQKTSVMHSPGSDYFFVQAIDSYDSEQFKPVHNFIRVDSILLLVCKNFDGIKREEELVNWQFCQHDQR